MCAPVHMHVSIDVLHCTACMLYALSLVLRPFFSSGKIPDGENILSPSVLLEGKRLAVVYVCILLLCVCGIRYAATAWLL